jgi:hypothetical protein
MCVFSNSMIVRFRYCDISAKLKTGPEFHGANRRLGIRFWPHGSKLSAIRILFLAGGDAERNVSAKIVKASAAQGAFGQGIRVVGRDRRYTAKHGDVVVLISQVQAGSPPCPRPSRLWFGTASSAFQPCSAGSRNGKGSLMFVNSELAAPDAPAHVVHSIAEAADLIIETV